MLIWESQRSNKKYITKSKMQICYRHYNTPRCCCSIAAWYKKDPRLSIFTLEIIADQTNITKQSETTKTISFLLVSIALTYSA